MKLTTILFERISPVVYHWTNLVELSSMLKTNVKQLNPAFGNPSDLRHNSGKLYFLSTSRVKWGGYSRSSFYHENIGIIVVLDGDKLNNNYAGRSVDYWGQNMRNTAFAMGRDTFLRNNENEDRLVTNKSEIKNIKAYINEIHIFVPPKPKPYAINGLNDIKNLFTPIYYYRSAEAFKTLNKSKASKEVPEYVGGKVDAGDEYAPRETKLEDMEGAVELFHSKDMKNLSEHAERMMWNLFRAPDMYIQEYGRGIETDVHNYGRPGPTRGKIDEFGKLMRKAHATNVKAFMKVIADKIERINPK